MTMEPTIKYKYPRTYHLPWSPGLKNDDRRIPSVEQFYDKEVVVTLKMDGENTSIYPDTIHARSLEKEYHESRNWVNKLQGNIGYLLNENERICGENVAAHHSIRYKGLDNFFYVFSYWIGGVCQSWDDTVKRCKELGLAMVPVLYRGLWDDEKIKACHQDTYQGNEMEGYVVRTAEGFHYDKAFFSQLAKYVRDDHVQTDEHWKKKPVSWNGWTL